MKTKQFITGMVSICIVFCFILTFTACNNDSDDDGPTTVDYRVTEKINTEVSGVNTWENKTIYSYLDNLLIEAIQFEKENNVWVEERKTEFEYNGDWVTSTRYYKDGDDWILEGMQSLYEMKIVDGKIMEIKYTYPNSVYREVFTYSRDKILKIENFYNEELRYKYECTYNGDNLVEIIEYDYYEGFEELRYKYEFTYTNGNLTQILGLYNNEGVWVNSDKDIYMYSGNKVVQIDDYDYYDGNWQLDDSEYYSYNGEGLLESISESGDGWTWEEIYTYEAGKGNYRLLYGDGVYYDVFNYPTAQRMSTANTGPEDSKLNIIRFLLR